MHVTGCFISDHLYLPSSSLYELGATTELKDLKPEAAASCQEYLDQEKQELKQ